MTEREARNVRRKAMAAFAFWTLLTGILALLGVGAAIQGLSGTTETPRAALAVSPAILWIAAWVWLCAWIVWSYRRQVPALSASDDPYDQSSASQHAQVAMRFTLRNLSGVELHGLRPTAPARFVNGQWPLVGHAAAIGLCIIAAAIG